LFHPPVRDMNRGSQSPVMSTGRSESRKRTRNKDQTIHRHLEASSTSGFSTVRTTFAASSRSSSTATTVWWIYVCALYSVAIPSTNRSPVLRVIDLPTAPVRHLHLQILGSRRSTWAPDDRLGFRKHHKKAKIAAGPVNRVEPHVRPDRSIRSDTRRTWGYESMCVS
jgi:hypothetical protein